MYFLDADSTWPLSRYDQTDRKMNVLVMVDRNLVKIDKRIGDG